LATPWTYFLDLSSVILTDSSTESPVHVLMLSIQAVRSLPRLRAPGVVPCITSFSRQLTCFLMVWPYIVRCMLASLLLTVSNSSLFTPALLRTHSFVFFAVHETRRMFISPFISKTVHFGTLQGLISTFQSKMSVPRGKYKWQFTNNGQPIDRLQHTDINTTLRATHVETSRT